jgi:phage terminase Nu1 subunit (DNA packaging protein)
MSMRYLSITQISEMCGLDRRTVKKRLASLKVHLVEGKSHLYDMFEANSMLYGTSTSDHGDTLAQMSREELRLETAKADKVELEVGRMKSELVSIEEVATVVEREYGAVRAGILSMPSKVAQDLVLMDQFVGIKNYLEDAINEILTELSADKAYADKHPPEPTQAASDEAIPNVTTPNPEALKEPTEDAKA